MLAALFEAVVGGEAGVALRARFFRQRVRRAQRGRQVWVRARYRRSDWPAWRTWSGHVVGPPDALRWRAPVRRWRRAALDGPVLGTEPRRSAARGSELVVRLPGFELVTSPEQAAVLDVRLAQR